jgi:hypothetical protein
MAATFEQINTRLTNAFPDSEIALKALVADNEHWEVC